jgi:hypothetical protein
MVDYGLALMAHWVALMSGIVSIAIGVWLRVRRWRKQIEGSDITNNAFLAVGVSCLFVAGYQTWLDEHKAVQQLTAKINDLSKPKFVVEIPQSINHYQPTDDTTVAFLAVAITNQGADSSVIGYHAHFHSPSLDSDVDIAHLVGAVSLPMPGGMELTLKDDNYIYNKTISIIPRGGSVIGRLPILIHGNHMKELNEGQSSIVVSASD